MSGSAAMPIRLPDRISRVLRIDPEAPALQFERRWRTWSYLSRAVDELDAELSRLGSGPAAAVGVVMRNRPEIVRAVTAALATGRCVVTLSPVAPRATLAEDIRRLGLSAVHLSPQDWDEPEVRAAVHDSGGSAVCVGDDDGRAVLEVAARKTGAGPALELPGVAIQMLTSGTTGPPKRVNLSYRSLEHEIESTARYSRSDDLSQVRLRSGTAILWAPLLHIGGMRGLVSALVAGRRVALMERFQVEAWRDLVLEHRPRVVSLAPTALRMVLDAGLPEATFEGIRAVIAGTAPVPPELADEFYGRYGVPVLVVYGATEFAGGVAGWTLRDWRQFGPSKRGSVGRANAGVSVRIVDPDSGSPLDPGGSGILEVRGAQLGTADWVRTSDMARMDEDGFIWILGRADDVIIRGGFKVSTTSVRDALASHPAVADASVIGIPDARLGQVPVAAVELKPTAAGVSGADLGRFLRERLSPYQVPVEIRVVDALPRTPSLKVSQPEVRKLFAPTSA